MGYKCTPQVVGLVRGEPKEGQKHRANGQKICEEAGNERYSRSVTLDRSRSTDNVYEGYRSGGKCWEDMETEAAEYRVKGKTKNGKDYERGLRADTVVGYAVIFNPPAAMTVDWTEDDYEQFYDDSWAVLSELEPRLFREDNVRMTARHKDEGVEDERGEYGEHMHCIGTAKDTEGRYCGNLIDAKLLVTLNREYPRMMRERGWTELDDLDVTDFERMGRNPDGTYKDPEYRAERAAKKAGRNVNRYVADTTAEALADARDAVEDALESARSARHSYVAADGERIKAEKARIEAEADREAAAEERRQAEAARREADTLRARLAAQEADIEAEKQKAVEMATEAENVRNEANKTLERARAIADAAPANSLAEWAKYKRMQDGRTVAATYEAERKRFDASMAGVDTRTVPLPAALESEIERQKQDSAGAGYGRV